MKYCLHNSQLECDVWIQNGGVPYFKGIIHVSQEQLEITIYYSRKLCG